MKKAILIFTATIVLVIITMLLCMSLFSSCDNNENNKYSKVNRFVEVENGRFNKNFSYTIYYDNETLIMYMLVRGTERVGLTVMVDKDGKPLLYNKDKEKE